MTIWGFSRVLCWIRKWIPSQDLCWKLGWINVLSSQFVCIQLAWLWMHDYMYLSPLISEFSPIWQCGRKRFIILRGTEIPSDTCKSNWLTRFKFNWNLNKEFSPIYSILTVVTFRFSLLLLVQPNWTENLTYFF